MKFYIAMAFLLSHSANGFMRATFRVAAKKQSEIVSNRYSHCASRRLSTMVDVENPLLQQDGLPKFQSIEPKDLTPAMDHLLSKMESEFAAFEEDLTSMKGEGPNADVTIDYEKVLPEIEKMQDGLGYAWGVAGHLNGVKNSEELREAYEQSQPKIVQAMSKVSQSKPVYDALSSIEKQWENQSDAASDWLIVGQRRRAVESSLRSMRNGGVGLEGAAKERFNEIKMRLAKLSTTFSNNVLDETKAFSITVTDPSKMVGVPDSAKSLWSNAHSMHLQKEGNDKAQPDPENGPWRITLDMPSYLAALQHLPDRSLREEVYMANVQRASEASKDVEKNNIPLIYEILRLKKEMADMLGFNSAAELSLSSKMAPSVESVQELSDLILEKALPAAERELAEITAMARAQGDPKEYSEENLPKLAPWDVTYWSERLKESKFELTEEETRPYFALPAVLDGMFALVERLFDVKVVAADGDAEVWNSDVSFFKVFDNASNKHIASFYLDPYSRPADKRGGAWMDVCVGKSAAVNREIPVAYLTCNGSPPVGDTPSLMTFREVETLFHETGHGLQHMLTRATVGDVAGINGVEWDAVELPSQFMENWCYDRPTIYGFAKHWQTGEPMPEDMFEKLKEQKTFNAGMMSCRQLLFGQLDMELHANFDAEKGEQEGGQSIFDVHRKMAKKYTPYSVPIPEDRFLCTFSHIFAGGYSAGYYSYKWAEVMSADAFSAFEEAGLDNEDAVKRVGKLFRETVLSYGGGVAPMDVFKEFRGREPSPEALLRHSGLA